MKPGKIVAVLIIIILLACINAVTEDKAQMQTGPDSALIDSVAAANDTTSVTAAPVLLDSIIVYYFHGTRRCATCKKIEAYSQEAVETKFKKELESGRLEFLPINFDEEGNEHFIEDYKLYTKSLIVCGYEKGKQVEWKNLEKVWEYVYDKDAFFKYVQDEVALYLGESINE
jgi:hypothetical protein